MDRLTPAQRSYLMSRVRTKDNPLELAVRSELHRLGYRFRTHRKGLPGTPDIVFVRDRIAVFVDGDFWHGYRLPAWERTLQPFWREKIRTNRRRDKLNFCKLRRRGWRVVRLWEHELKRDLSGSVQRIISLLANKNCG
jgi:DNA mismatch endonuclease (patch repair protein)